jgi:ABC-type nitrate/sulfonate/bicarbonate transport system substrate-binding protein
MKRNGFAWIVFLAALLLAACGQPAIQSPTEEAAETSEPEAAAPGGLIPVTVMLDWVPNTNHIGLFVAEANGYFADQGLDVEIIQPADTPVEQVVAGGAASFGVSYQEQVTFSRTAGVPVVSIAAIIQHNTSGFAALAEKGIETPADLAGLRYGAFGSPIEDATLELLLSCFDADAATIDMINVGYDLMPLLERDEIDFAWIFYAWDGLRAEQQGIDLDILMLADYADCVPDYYTPVLIAGESLLQENPDLARAFLAAVSRGYTFAAENPQAAADILVAAAPELEAEADLVRASLEWLGPRFQDDAPRWGEQSLDVWRRYADFLLNSGVLQGEFDPVAAFSNAYLPE